jgi:hypothetical protein
MAMRTSSLERLMREVGKDDLVLDVGGWIQPFTRADWVLDLMPYDTRGRHGSQGEPPERFSRETWVQRDICDHEPWPFEDDQFDFVVCAHTLEDVRDPIWVCRELARVARAGYIEVPSRLEEHAACFQGPWVGWGHHRWFAEVGDGRIDFVLKHHVIHTRSANYFPQRYYDTLTEDQRAQTLWWEGSFQHGERIMLSAEELDPYLGDFVAAHRRSSRLRERASDLLHRLAYRVR